MLSYLQDKYVWWHRTFGAFRQLGHESKYTMNSSQESLSIALYDPPGSMFEFNHRKNMSPQIPSIIFLALICFNGWMDAWLVEPRTEPQAKVGIFLDIPWNECCNCLNRQPSTQNTQTIKICHLAYHFQIFNDHRNRQGNVQTRTFEPTNESADCR